MSYMNKSSIDYLFLIEITVIFSLPFCLGQNKKPSGENGHSLFFSAMEGKQSSSLNSKHLQTNTNCALQFKESPKHIYLSTPDEDCYGMWNIIIQKLESAADTKPDNEKQNFSRIILPSKTGARSLIRKDRKLISDSHFQLYIT